jgi:beta-lactamase class A
MSRCVRSLLICTLLAMLAQVAPGTPLTAAAQSGSPGASSSTGDSSSTGSPLSAGATGSTAAPAQPAARPAATDTAALRRELTRLAAGYAGVAGISVRNLATGEAVSIRGHETFPSASLIKVGVLVALLEEVERGRMRLDERSTLIARDRVGGDGVLRYMQSGVAPALEDLAWLMITISDNTATNLILDKLDMRTVGVKLEALGLPHSKIHSKTFRRETSIAPDSSVLYGLGVTTPDETVQLFSLLHEGRAVSPALDSLAMRMLFANQDNDRLVRWLPPGTRVAHKSGAVERARNDCGIMYTPAAPIAICVMTRDNEATSYAVDNPAYLLAARAARATFQHYNPGVPLPPLPVF